MAQAEEARARLIAAHGWPQAAVELVPVTASGDKVLDRPLAEIGGKALWTKELDGWLLAGEIDFAVHSLKDVETIRPAAIALAAILPREDVRDCLVSGPDIPAASIADLPPGARIGTSAPRRAAQMLHARPDLVIVPFRGNVATRLGKLAAGEADATLLAMAGLNRLGETLGTALPADSWLPACGQGAIAIEARAADAATCALLAPLNHAPSRAEVLAERALLAALGGNCHSALAVHSTWEGADLCLAAALYSADGAAKVAGTARLTPGDSAPIAALAADLLGQSPAAIRALFTGPHPIPA